jgi:hypothetical protein
MLNIYAAELLLAQRTRAAERYWAARADTDAAARRPCAYVRRPWWRPALRPCTEPQLTAEPRRPVTVLP